jgi:hypothetical protein
MKRAYDPAELISATEDAKVYSAGHRAAVLKRLADAMVSSILANLDYVEWIRYELFDESRRIFDEPSRIYFRIVVADKASNPLLLKSVYLQVHQTLDLTDYGYACYHNFRTVSEQRQMKDPEWEKPE